MSSEGIPRKRDSAATKAAIQDAATRLFARRGYSATGLREIAAQAGVDVAMVARYFGSKRDLFRACVEAHVDAAPALSMDPASFGEAMVQFLIDKDPDHPDITAMLILASSDEEVGELARQILNERFVEPVANWLKGRKRRQRASAITMLLTGISVNRSTLQLEGFTGKMDASVRAWLAASLDALCTGQSFGDAD